MQHGDPMGRRRDIDRLRIAACLAIFVYHTTQVFDFNPYYHVKSHTFSGALDVLARLLQAVHMPLFFLISGMVTLLLLRQVSVGRFVTSRAARLLPPFLLGIVLLTPWIKYLELADGRSIHWYGIVPILSAPDPLVLLRRYATQFKWFSWSHMWFLIYLFLLSVLLLPAFRGLARWRATAASAAFPVVLPLPLFVAMELVLRPRFPEHIPNLIWDWASVAVYVIAMLTGAAWSQSAPTERLLHRLVPVSVLATGLGVWLYLSATGWPGIGVGRALTLWGTLCLLIGLSPLLSRGRIVGEDYLNEAALPLFVLHHLPLVSLAFALKDQPWPLWQRYGAILCGSFAVTLLAYEFLVRRFAPARAVLGLKRSPY